KYERGRLNPSLGKVKEIAEALDVTIQELIVGDYVRTDKIQGVLEKDISIFSTKELIDELYRRIV
ncbi:MAG: helix-turn-helix transcriptional regulator, partial [Peptostreptococcaceae bacterium]